MFDYKALRSFCFRNRFIWLGVVGLSLHQKRKSGIMNLVVLLQIVMATINLAALTIFGIDKLQSKRGSWRVPEMQLLLVAFFGPFGALAGMLLFRHKTRKVKFLLVPVFLIFQVFLIEYFLGFDFFLPS